MKRLALKPYSLMLRGLYACTTYKINLIFWLKTMLVNLATQITDVIVYTDRALITRQGTIVLEGTETQLAIANLPTTLDPESVRISGHGQVLVKLLGVTTEREYRTEPVGDRIRQLTQEIEQLEIANRRLQAQVDSIEMQSSFIQGLRQQTEESFSRGLAKQKLSLKETLNFLDFIGKKHTEYAHVSQEIQQQQQQLNRQLQALQSQLKQLKTPRSFENFQIDVAIEPTGAGEFQLEVTYMVNHAAWKPLYDLRVQRQETQIQLSYLAEITQTSGEDWTDVKLSLSTAKPGLGSIPPKLTPWYLYVSPPPDLRRKRAEQMRSPAAPAMAYLGATDDVEASEILFEAEEQGDFVEDYVAETSMADVSQQGSVVTFQLGDGNNIPSDGTPHKVTVLYDRFPCEFTYLAIPRLVSFAYLQTKAKNHPTGATLLSGKANIFQDEIFVGTTQLENIAPGQEFKLNLGIDEGLKIDRELVERQVDKKFLGGQRRITYAYRLAIANLLKQPVQLELNEQIPHSRNEQIKAKLTKSSPSIQLGELSRLTWELNLSAQSKTEVYYQFTIEHPENIQVIGLDL
jgi:uncharacterized protein (TIGR02231 family)